MKIKNKDKFWELATGKIHNELTSDETGELDLLLQDDDNKKLFQDIVKTNDKIQNIEFLQQVSIENSRQKISAFFSKKKIDR